MERILQFKAVDKVSELKEIKEDCFNINNPYILFPVRHHSPACSWHLNKVFESYKPDAVLIEGPLNTNHMIPYIVDEKTVPPISIYYVHSSILD